MPWSEKDKVLFSIVNQFGEKYLEKQIENASAKFLTLKKRPNFFVIFGYYNLNNNVFIWQNKMNEISYDFVKKNYMTLFNTDKTIKKLFNPDVMFEEKNMNIIPYLMEALNAQFNVIRFKGPTDYIYALTSIDDIKESFKYDEFNDVMFLYRYFNRLDKNIKSKHKKRKNKRHTQKSKRKERV